MIDAGHPKRDKFLPDLHKNLSKGEYHPPKCEVGGDDEKSSSFLCYTQKAVYSEGTSLHQ